MARETLPTLTIDALWTAARDELHQDGPAPHLVELHRRGSREIYLRALRACGDHDRMERELGVRVLRELGGSPPRFAAEATAHLLGMLEHEADAHVLAWIVSAIGYQHMGPRLTPLAGVLEPVIAAARHPDRQVRHAVAAALPCLIDEAAPQPAAVAALIALTDDEDADTRWYALAALVDDLGLATEPAVLTALFRRAADPDQQIRAAVRRVAGGGEWGEP